MKLLHVFLCHSVLYLILAILLLPPCVSPSLAEDGDATTETAAFKVFDDKEANPTAKIEKLRALLRQDHANGTVRYLLAMIMADTATDLTTLSEALLLTNGMDRMQSPDWLPAFVVIPRLKIVQRIKGFSGGSLGNLEPGKFRYTCRPEFAQWLKGYLSRDASELLPLLKMYDSARLKERQDRGRVAEFKGDEVRADIRQLAQILSARWCFLKEKQVQTGLSLQQWQAENLALVKDQMSKKEVELLLARAIADLGDGHAQCVLETGDPRYLLQVRLMDTPQGVIITKTDDPKLKAGDRLLTVNGRDIEESIAEYGPMIAGSSRSLDRLMRVPVAAIVDVKDGDTAFPVRIERDGVEITVSCTACACLLSSSDDFVRDRLSWLSCGWIDPVSRMPVPIQPAKSEKSGQANSLPSSSSIGYVRIPTWMIEFKNTSDSAAEDERIIQSYCSKADAALAPLRDCSDIIVDIRDNAGGHARAIACVGSYFCSDRSNFGIEVRDRISTESKGYFSAKPGTEKNDGFRVYRTPHFDANSRAAYKARIWLLVNENCASASHLFTHLLVACNPPERIHTIGRSANPSASYSDTFPCLKNTGARLKLSHASLYSLKGELLDGNPTPMNIPVTWTRADILAGRDPDMEAALKAIEDARAKSADAHMP